MVDVMRPNRLSAAGTLTRRSAFRLSAGALAVAVAWAYGSRPSAGVGSIREAMALYRLSTIAPLVGEAFSLSTGNAAIALTLDSVTDLRSPSQARDSSSCAECFSMLFAAASDSSLPQATYRLEHAVLGSLLLFMVPMSIDGDRRLYEAIVNNQLPGGR